MEIPHWKLERRRTRGRRILETILAGTLTLAQYFLPATQASAASYLKRPEKPLPTQVIVKLKESTIPLETQLIAATSPRTIQARPAKEAVDNIKYQGFTNVKPLFPIEESNRIKSQRVFSKVPQLGTFYVIPLEQGQNPEKIIRDLKQRLGIEDAWQDIPVQLTTTPNDPFFSSSNSFVAGLEDMHALKASKAPQAWEHFQRPFKAGEGVVVAIIGTGVGFDNHTELQGNILPDGYDFVNNDTNPSDDNGHETHVAGIIAAKGDNLEGIIGIAPGVWVLPEKVLNSQGAGLTSYISQAIRHATNHGARIVNISLGSSFRAQAPPDLVAAFQYADSNDVLSVVAAGNSADDVAHYPPANVPGVVVVSNFATPTQRDPLSNFGALVSLGAIGSNVLSLRALPDTDFYTILSGSQYTAQSAFVPPFDPLAKYYVASGTSQASPIAAGVAALAISRWEGMAADGTNIRISAKGLREHLEFTATDVGPAGRDPDSGAGLVNAEAAVSYYPDVLVQSVITNSTHRPFGSSISENWFVYNDLRNDPINQINRDVFIKNLQTGQEFQITNNQNPEQGFIHNNNIIFGRFNGRLVVPTPPGNLYSIYLGQDSMPGTSDDLPEQQLTSSNSVLRHWAADKNKIVFLDKRNTQNDRMSDIFLIDIGPDGVAGTSDDVGETRITTRSADWTELSISDDNIVYGERDGDPNTPDPIHLFNIPTGRETQIARGFASQMSGNIVVYYRGENGKTNIFTYDLSSNLETRITTGEADIDPRIYENTIAYLGGTGLFNGKILCYDLSTGKEFAAFIRNGSQTPVALYKNMILLDDCCGGQPGQVIRDYHLARLPYAGAVPQHQTADIDRDNDTDLADYIPIISAYSGPGNPTINPRADLDRDGDVDLADLIVFQGQFTGSR